MINVYVQFITNFFLKNIYLSIYLAALGLNCGMRAWLPHEDPLVGSSFHSQG